MPNNLTTLANVNAWLPGATAGTNPDNQLLARLIAQASRFIYGYIQRSDLILRSYSDVYDGSGSSRLVLRNYPVLSVSSLIIGSQKITASPSYGQSGYFLEPPADTPPGRPQSLDLFGNRFWPGHSNVAVTYMAGYAVSNEPQTVPDDGGYSVAVDAPYGIWSQDNGVTYANGTPLTKVVTAPTIGQYTINGNGMYSFAAADANAAVLITYSYVPFDLEQACIEMVCERYTYKDRVGVASKSLGGQETMSYSLKGMQDYVTDLLQPYVSVLIL